METDPTLFAMDVEVETPAPAPKAKAPVKAELMPEPEPEVAEELDSGPGVPAEDEAEPQEEAPEEELAHDAETEEAEAEAPAAPIAPDKPDRLARFRKDKAIDEDALAAEVEQLENAAKTVSHIDSMIREDPELRIAYWKSLDKKGQLPPEYKAQLDAAVRPAAPVVPEKPERTEQEVREEARKMLAAGREEDAVILLQSLAVDPIAKKLAAIEAGLNAEAQRREQAQRKMAEQVNQDRVLGELQRLATKHPTLMKKTGNGIEFLDKAFQAELARCAKGMGFEQPLDEVADYALFKLGRLQAKPPPAAKKPAHKPALNNAPSLKAKNQNVLAPGEFAMEFE